MLHEVLLALSGHRSPLFDDNAAEDFPHITPAETRLLQSLGRLASLNRALQSHASRISTSHPSAICRAVANELSAHHLSKFRRCVVQVEERILTSNPSDVGAYDIVPLAGIVSDFGGWERTFEWCWETLCFVLPADSTFVTATSSPRKDGLRNGAALMNKLRQDVNTGYAEIEDAALSLLKSAEAVWIRQLSSWLLQGSVSKYAIPDFFVQPTKANKNTEQKFAVNYALLPDFLARDTAQSIHYIGKTVNYLDSEPSVDKAHTTSNRLDQVRLLSNLTSPISPAALNTAIFNMRSARTRQLVHGLLPVQKTIQTLSYLREIFLLHWISFTDALVTESDQHLRHRHAQMRTVNEQGSLSSLAGAMMKQAEVSGVLSKTWTQLAPETIKDATLEDRIEWGRENLLLELRKSSSDAEEPSDDHDVFTLPSRKGGDNVFSEFLLSAPTILSMALNPPLNLFLTVKDLKRYSSMHAYLSSIRRAHIHLSDLWRRNSLRRGSPVVGGSRRSTRFGIQSAKVLRTKNSLREHSMRATWATASVALFLLTELGEYLISEVVTQSWGSFEQWISDGHNSPPSSTSRMFKPHSQDAALHDSGQHTYIVSERAQDPELLALAHRQYLSALQSSLLLSDGVFVELLRDFLMRIDQLAAFVGRLQTAYSNSDLQDEGVLENLSRDYMQEEVEAHQDVVNGSLRIDDSIKRLTHRLREMNAARYTDESHRDTKIKAKTSFEPWNGTSIDRLLLRLQSDGDDQHTP